MNTQNKALITLFGATGDLAHRKLYPSLFRLYKKGFLQENFAVIGTARRPWTDEYFHSVIADSIQGLAKDEAETAEFTSHFYYLSHNVNDTEHYHELKKLSEQLDEKYGLQGNRVFYLAMSPEFFGTIATKLKECDLLTADGYNRLIIEKPFGRDYSSAKELNDQLSSSFSEDQIYRIDHYLGKEMVQNIPAVRFSNMVLESLWNNKYIDNIQITLAETVGVEDRGVYYDSNGALRDMVQNHVLQILSLLAMEPPLFLHGQHIRDEKIKLLHSLRLYQTPEEVTGHFVRAQYTGNPKLDKPAYVAEPKVDPNSQTETFVAGKILIDNFRWSGVPFYVRTGKSMDRKETIIKIQFKQVPKNIFQGENILETTRPNVLTIHVSPQEGFALQFNSKKFGQGTEIEAAEMSRLYDKTEQANSPEAYERLILDCLNGDPTNFSHWEEVAQSWHFVDGIRKIWDEGQAPLYQYESGSMGPEESFQLLQQDGFDWI